MQIERGFSAKRTEDWAYESKKEALPETGRALKMKIATFTMQR
jgi:hypothetical protein